MYAKEALDRQTKEVTAEAEDEQTKNEQQAQLVNQPAYDAKNRWWHQRKVSNEAGEAFEDADEAESGRDDARDGMSFNEAKEDASVQVKADVLDLMLNAKVQTRQKPSNTAVKSVIEVSCTDVEKERLNLNDEDSVHAEGCPNMKVEDWSLVSSNWN